MNKRMGEGQRAVEQRQSSGLASRDWGGGKGGGLPDERRRDGPNVPQPYEGTGGQAGSKLGARIPEPHCPALNPV